MDIMVKCTNPDCASNGIVKQIGRIHLGNNVFQGGKLLCTCGFVMAEAE